MSISRAYIVPNGIQVITRKNKDSSEVTSYRVQIKRKELKVDEIFRNVDEAISFLNKCKKKLGLKPVSLVLDVEESLQTLEGQRLLQRIIAQNVCFGDYIDKYIEHYIKPKFQNIVEQMEAYDNLNRFDKNGKVRKTKTRYSAIFKSGEEKKQYRQYYNTIQFFKIIRKQTVQIGKKTGSPYIDKLQSKMVDDCTIEEITPITINSYIKNRIIQKMRKGSIERELNFISNVFSKLKYFNDDYITLSNPVLQCDRELLELAEKPKPKFFRFKQERLEEYLKVIDEHSNQEMGFIVRLMLFTAMRRSEVVLLKWSQVFDDYIELPTTKTEPRTVFLTKQAKELISNIPKVKNRDRLFTYTVSGFEGSYTKFLATHDMKDITAHKLRKEAVSNFIELIGAENSLLIAEILGISNVNHLEKTIKKIPLTSIDTQSEVLKSIGHKNPNMTKKHYFSIKKEK